MPQSVFYPEHSFQLHLIQLLVHIDLNLPSCFVLCIALSSMLLSTFCYCLYILGEIECRRKLGLPRPGFFCFHLSYASSASDDFVWMQHSGAIRFQDSLFSWFYPLSVHHRNKNMNFSYQSLILGLEV